MGPVGFIHLLSMFYALQTNNSMQDVSSCIIFQRKGKGERVKQAIFLLNVWFVILEIIKARSEVPPDIVLELILEAFFNQNNCMIP